MKVMGFWSGGTTTPHGRRGTGNTFPRAKARPTRPRGRIETYQVRARESKRPGRRFPSSDPPRGDARARRKPRHLPRKKRIIGSPPRTPLRPDPLAQALPAMSWGVKAGAMRQLKLYPDPEVKTEVRASPFASARASSPPASSTFVTPPATFSVSCRRRRSPVPPLIAPDPRPPPFSQRAAPAAPVEKTWNSARNTEVKRLLRPGVAGRPHRARREHDQGWRHRRQPPTPHRGRDGRPRRRPEASRVHDRDPTQVRGARRRPPHRRPPSDSRRAR